jgi:hypothetical protein
MTEFRPQPVSPDIGDDPGRQVYASLAESAPQDRNAESHHAAEAPAPFSIETATQEAHEQGQADFYILTNPDDQRRCSVMFPEFEDHMTRDDQRSYQQALEQALATITPEDEPGWRVSLTSNGLAIKKFGPNLPQFDQAFAGLVDRAFLEQKVALVRRDIQAFRPVFEAWARQLAAPLAEGRWDSIVGEDRSGRLPALFAGKLASHYAHDRGVPPPRRLFLAGGKVTGEVADATGFIDNDNLDKKAPESDEWLRQKADALDARLAHQDFEGVQHALVVTDKVEDGGSLRRVKEALSRRRIACDLAVFETPHTLPRLEALLASDEPQDEPPAESEIFIGQADANGAELFYKNALKQAAGVRRRAGEGKADRHLAVRPELKTAARQAITELVDDIYARLKDAA